MQFLNPLALAWALLAIPIVIFYLLKVRRRRLPISTALFWRKIYPVREARSIWERLRHLISLLVQCALLALLVLALAEPIFPWQLRAARRVVLVIDNSASMQATDVAPTRLARAKELGLSVVAGLRFRDELAIVAAGTEPRVVCGFSGHQRTLERALADLPPTDGPTRVADAVALARGLIDQRQVGQIVVISDGCFPDAQPLSTAADIQWWTVSQRSGNLGFTQFQVRRNLVDPIAYEILAEVRNSADETARCRLEIFLNDQIVDVVPLELAAGETWNRVFQQSSAKGGRLRASLDRADALAADNQAWAVLPEQKPQPVLLVGPANLFVQKVLESHPLVELTVLKQPPARWTADAITVCYRQVPEKIPPGNVLVIDPAGSCDLWQVGDKLTNPLVTRQDRDSPLMAHVRLDNVLLPEARKLDFKTKPHVLAATLDEAPVYAALERPAGKVLVLSVNLDQGDLPLRTAFPIMISNALAWFAGEHGQLRESLATGAVAEVTLPPEMLRAATAAPVRLWPPTGESRALPPGSDKMLVGPLERCGVWSLAPTSADHSDLPGTPAVAVACNLASRQESDLRPAESLLAKTPPTIVAAGLFTRPVWFYLLAAAFLLAVAEWFLYQRRWIS
jgi:hypothetical protein